MSSDKPFGAADQQERPGSTDWLDQIPDDVGHYIAGFIEGEGSFNVPIRREHDRTLPWRVGLSFNVSQVGRELPQFLLDTFERGTVRGRQDGVFYFEVTRPTDLVERVFPFFERYGLRGPKAHDLAVFREITEFVQRGRHREPAGVIEIVRLRGPMNRGGKRRRSDDEIITALQDLESSEAIRRAPS